MFGTAEFSHLHAELQHVDPMPFHVKIQVLLSVRCVLLATRGAGKMPVMCAGLLRCRKQHLADPCSVVSTCSLCVHKWWPAPSIGAAPT